MSKYQELLRQALTVLQNVQQKVRGPSGTKRIVEAVDGFTKPFDDLADAAAKSKSGSDPGDSALLEVLRRIESQRALLQSEVERAEADDERVVQGVVVDKQGAQALAGKQKAADQQFLAKVNEILDIVREDLCHPNS